MEAGKSLRGRPHKPETSWTCESKGGIKDISYRKDWWLGRLKSPMEALRELQWISQPFFGSPIGPEQTTMVKGRGGDQ